MDSIKEYDKMRKRCPKLGHEVPFSYCRQPGSQIPCGKIRDCWFESFDVDVFLKKNYDVSVIKRVIAPPENKISSIFNIINEVKKRQEGLKED